MELKTKKGESFLIDDEDYDLVKDITWGTCVGYFRGWCKERKKVIKIHRLIMGVWESGYPQIDHINRDKSDNRKCNLRFCTPSENSRNRNSRGKSKHVGVHIHYRKNKYTKKNGDVVNYPIKILFQARIFHNSKRINLGYFEKEIDAAKAYNEAAKKYHGEFVNLNIID